MKRILHFCLLFGLFFGILVPTRAAHIIGGEITYECLGYTGGDPNSNSRTYQFTMKIYRDCQGGGADFDSAPFGAFTASVTFYQEGSNSPFQTLYLQAPAETFVDPNPGNPCVQVPGNVCVEEGVYIFPEIDLPIIEDSYFIAYQRCCRNNTISNIADPGGSGATYFIELTAEAQASCNNSPVFNNFPPIVLCANQPFVFDHSATDAEGDQLVYEFCTPFLGGGLNFDVPEAGNGIAPDPDLPPPYDAVQFLAPNYTPLTPLGNASPVTIDLTSGEITGTPGFIGQFVVGVCVSEYRNGQLLSVVRRDFQFNITSCEPTVVADLQEDEMVNDQFVISQCGDTRVTFINQSYQQSFISDFRWEFDLDTGTVVNDINWNVAQDFETPGTYNGRLLLNPGTECGDTADILVNIFPDLEADFNFAYDTCVAGPVNFENLSYTNAEMITNYSWDFGDGAGSAGTDPIHTFASPGNKTVNLRITDNNDCEAQVSKDIPYFPVPALIVVSPDAFTGCAPGDIFFDNLSTPINGAYDIFWDFGDGESGTAISPTHTFTEPGIFSVSLEIISPIGCQTDTTFTDLIEIEPSPVADFVFSPDNPDNFAPEVTFTDRSSGASRWFWDFNSVATSIEQNPAYSFRDTGKQEITLIVTHPSGCQDSVTQIVDIAPQTTFFMPNAFSPNGDSVNDVFKGKGYLEGIKQFELQIWNRWGQQVFITEDPLEGWNGRVGRNGKDAPPGMYLYHVKMTGPRGEPSEWTGYATLIR